MTPVTLKDFLGSLSTKVAKFSLSTPALLFYLCLSYDRVPFLMHDFDLRRTTNIWEVQPYPVLEFTIHLQERSLGDGIAYVFFCFCFFSEIVVILCILLSVN